MCAGPIRATLQSLRQVFGQWYDLQALTPDINSMLLFEVLKYEQMKVNALHEMLKNRDVMIMQHSKAVRRQDQLETDYQKASTRDGAAERSTCTAQGCST